MNSALVKAAAAGVDLAEIVAPESYPHFTPFIEDVKQVAAAEALSTCAVVRAADEEASFD